MSSASAAQGIPFVVAAPSGTGKTSVCRRVVELDDGISFSVSHTTRKQRAGEEYGRDYFFVNEAEFRRMAAEGAFLEWAEYNANLYGTSWAAVEAGLADGRDLLLEIEVQGARQVRRARPDARMIFLLPPSMRELERRLRGRGTDSDAEILRRLSVAARELESMRDFDYAVTNDAFDACVEQVLEIVRAERACAPGDLRERFAPALAEERLRGARVSGA